MALYFFRLRRLELGASPSPQDVCSSSEEGEKVPASEIHRLVEVRQSRLVYLPFAV